MSACGTCGACSDCQTWNEEDCNCCDTHGCSRDECGCRWCEDCENYEPTDNWCEHGCDHCADCCEWGDEPDSSGELRPGGCCAEAVGVAEEGVDNDYLDTALATTTPEELAGQWEDRKSSIIKTMEGVGGDRAKGCPVGYNAVHPGKECNFGYRPDLYVVHHSHTASDDGQLWQADFVHYGWSSDERKPPDAMSAVTDISDLIHKTCGR